MPALQSIGCIVCEYEKGLTSLHWEEAEGRKADIAKPMKGLGSGIYEIALRFHSDAYRTVYAVNIGEDVWVIHAFKKKSRTGIKTPQPEIDVIRERIKRLKELLNGRACHCQSQAILNCKKCFLETDGGL